MKEEEEGGGRRRRRRRKPLTLHLGFFLSTFFQNKPIQISFIYKIIQL